MAGLALLGAAVWTAQGALAGGYWRPAEAPQLPPTNVLPAPVSPAASEPGAASSERTGGHGFYYGTFEMTNGGWGSLVFVADSVYPTEQAAWEAARSAYPDKAPFVAEADNAQAAFHLVSAQARAQQQPPATLPWPIPGSSTTPPPGAPPAATPVPR